MLFWFGETVPPCYGVSMSALGVHFSLTDKEVRKLESRKSDDDRLEYVKEEMEESFFDSREDDMVESESAWDAIHRCLTDGTLRGATGLPLEIVVLGGQSLYAGNDYIMTLKRADQVRAAAPLLAAFTRETMRAAYNRLNPKNYDGDIGDDDFEYTWDHFQQLRAFWQRAAQKGRHVLFTADQ